MDFLKALLIFIQTLIVVISPSPSYTEGVVGQPRSFFPHQTITQTDKTISNLIYRGIFKYDNFGELVPDLAESWTISDNETVYTIKIKSGQYWSDGSQVTSNDLIYTAFKMPDLAGVATDKVDDYTVRYTLPNKYSPFLSLLTLGVMKSDDEDKSDPLRPVSSGIFQVSQIERSGPVIKKVTLVSLDQSLNIRKIIFKFYENDDEVVVAARLGEIDGFLTSKVVNTELSNYENHRFPVQGVYYGLFFNLNNSKFSDLLFRQKLERVLPIEKMIYDRGIEVQGPISRSNYTDRTVIASKYNESFKEDISNTSLTITMPDIKGLDAVAEEVKKYWEDKLSIVVQIQKVAPEIFLSDVVIPRNYEVLLYGQEVGRDPDRYVYWHSTQAEYPGLNLSAFSQIRADRALEEGRNEVDPDKRMIHYHEFQKVIAEQTPAIFLYHPYYNHYVNKYISGVGDKYTYEQKDRFLDLSTWQRIQTN